MMTSCGGGIHKVLGQKWMLGKRRLAQQEISVHE